MKGLSIYEWANGINDDKLHHIGEYYTLRYGKPFQKKGQAALTKGFLDWLLNQSLNEIHNHLSPKFKILRDMNPLAFFIQKKEKKV